MTTASAAVTLSPTTIATVSATVDEIGVVSVSVSVARDGQTVGSFGSHDLGRRARPESRPALQAAIDAVRAEAEASPEYAAARARCAAHDDMDREYAAAYSRIERAMRGDCRS